MKIKRLLALLIFAAQMVGCSYGNDQMNRALGLRERMLKAESCSFDAIITADYGEDIYIFHMSCIADSAGKLSFTVSQPESIAGITGIITSEDGKLIFDDHALAFPILADGQITPVAAPWVLVHTLRSGYINACGNWDDGVQLLIDDSYKEDALQLDIKLDAQDVPVSAEILWHDRRVLSIDVSKFLIL